MAENHVRLRVCVCVMEGGLSRQRLTSIYLEYTYVTSAVSLQEVTCHVRRKDVVQQRGVVRPQVRHIWGRERKEDVSSTDERERDRERETETERETD